MKKTPIGSWREFTQWVKTYNPSSGQYAFRGQANAEWNLDTSLARLFWRSEVNAREWRLRELKMYRLFRQSLIGTFPGKYETAQPLDILAAMQHYGAPTRLIDFTFCPYTAAFFALERATVNCSLYVVDTKMLRKLRKASGEPAYVGPTHIGGYKIAVKDNAPPSFLQPRHITDLLAAQKGCFVVSGRISKQIGDQFILEKAVLSKELVPKALCHLNEMQKDREHLFPELKDISDRVLRLAVSGSPE